MKPSAPRTTASGKAPGNLRAQTLLSRPLFVLLVVGLSLTVSLLTRLALLALEPEVLGSGSWPLLRTLALGEFEDLKVALWVAVPWVLYLLVLPERWYAGRFHRVWLRVALGGAVAWALFVAVAEGFFFDEFAGRFNFVAVDYLLFPSEVATSIWESYHTGLWLLAIGGVGLLVIWRLSPLLDRAWLHPSPLARRGLYALAFGAALALVTIALPGSSLTVAEDRRLNEIADNGYHTFWLALLGRDAPYRGWYASSEAAELAARLPRLVAEPTATPSTLTGDWTTRRVSPPGPARRLNVVIVLEESLGSEFVGALNPGMVSRTPELDRLAGEGTLLTQAFSTGNRTIRALEATTASIPPLPGISIVRRDQSQNLFTLPALLRERGYQTLFVYGGRALFDGMGAYLNANGVERVVDQTDFPSGLYTTAWGVADEFIFDRALTELDAMEGSGRPFYALVLSVSNHRPFLFPEGRITPKAEFHRRGNAVYYADYALGRFMRQAKDHAFFDHTLFVLMGDHGARVYGAAEIPMASYQVPILFLGPGSVPAGQRLDTLASSLDVPPTILGLLGESYESKFFGHDLFHLDPARGRAFMTHNSNIALLEGDRLAVLGLHQSVAHYRWNRGQGTLTRIEAPDAQDRELAADAIASYSGADQLYRSGAYTLAPLPLAAASH